MSVIDQIREARLASLRARHEPYQPPSVCPNTGAASGVEHGSQATCPRCERLAPLRLGGAFALHWLYGGRT